MAKTRGVSGNELDKLMEPGLSSLKNKALSIILLTEEEKKKVLEKLEVNDKLRPQ